jgi:putative glutamine amidotransferase
MGPRIGIAPCLDAGGRIRQGRVYHYIDQAYARAIVEAGAVPVYLAAPADPGELCAGVDGLLLPGGDDFSPPAPYPADVAFDLVAPEQLAFDGALLEAALARSIPVLGICYGMQLLCRHHGGELLYHLPHDRPEAGPHRLPEAAGRHPLRVEPDSQLATALGERPPPVNSLHHQGVAEPGRGLRVAARADDGVIEAIEASASRPFLLGVQWHPEKMDGVHRTRLFEAFATACGEFAEERAASDPGA